jgi:cytochrome bd-type quinol oxidase subunit 1
MAMWMALLVAPIQAVVGDMHGLNTLEHQPAKIAAMAMGEDQAAERRDLQAIAGALLLHIRQTKQQQRGA